MQWWQWTLIAIPTLVLVLSAVMVTRIALSLKKPSHVPARAAGDDTDGRPQRLATDEPQHQATGSPRADLDQSPQAEFDRAKHVMDDQESTYSAEQDAIAPDEEHQQSPAEALFRRPENHRPEKY